MRLRPLLLPVFLLSVASCAPEDAPSILEPAGPGAERVEELWWPMFWISVVVLLVVVGMVAVSIARARGARGEVDRSEVRWGEPFIVIAGVVIPALILVSVFVWSLRQMNILAAQDDDARLRVEVVAHDWWWEARYPNGAVTANEIHIPVGEPVLLALTTADVIHSFWVPRLQVKTDHIPGKDNYLWIEASKPGRYRGFCAEFCGLQHAKMQFFVVADPPEEFARWVATEALPADAPGTASARLGEAVFLSSSCVGCHPIRGTPADADVGPDLTHLARRETIGAGILPNTREALALFVTDPQRVKPGAPMPPTELTDDELAALLDYLAQLD